MMSGTRHVEPRPSIESNVGSIIAHCTGSEQR